jgi:hypothetical protein
MPKEKYKFHQSIYFEDMHSNRLFLFQVINFGKIKDEMKFAFNYPGAGTGVVHSDTSTFSDPTDILAMRAEITYHSDGSFLNKFPSQPMHGSPIYKNPFGTGKRRKPLDMITEWEPILSYTVANYSICRKPYSEDGFLVPYNPCMFGGEPFVCIIGLGLSSNSLPQVNPTKEVVARIKHVGSGLDLVLNFTKTSYRGIEIRIPNTEICIWSTNNVLQTLCYKGSKPM